MSNLETQNLDRSAFSVVDLSLADDEPSYWHRQSPEARIEHMLRLRKMNYGDAASGRLQRVLEVVELTQG